MPPPAASALPAVPHRGVHRAGVLPGFGISLGLTLTYLGFIVLLPLIGLFAKAAALSWTDLATTLTEPRTLAAFRVSFGLSLAAAAMSGAIGLLLAWVLVRYDFPGRRLIDALI